MLVNDNPNLKIDSIFAFVAQGPEGEGIMAAQFGDMMMPLIGADLDRIQSLLPVANHISQESGKEFKIYRFDNKVDITGEFNV